MEIALLFDNVYLNDPFEGAKSVLDNLVGEGIITSWINPNIPDYRTSQTKIDDIDLAFDIKPLIFNHLTKLYKNTRPQFAQKSELIDKLVYGLYDFVVLWRAGLYEEAVEYTNLPFKDLFNSKGNPIDFINQQFERTTKGKKSNGFIMDFLLMEFEISSILSLIKLSKKNNSSIATSVINSISKNIEVESVHNAYTLCLLPMQEEIRFAPVVDSIKDLIRLRSRPEVIRFREVLQTWKSLVLSGEIEVAEKIRKDIQKANEEIKKLEKWKTVDKWFYYLSLPTMFVPFLSNVISVGSVCTRFNIERTEKEFGWIGIAQ